jgi:hypothetical protein
MTTNKTSVKDISPRLLLNSVLRPIILFLLVPIYFIIYRDRTTETITGQSKMDNPEKPAT